MLNVKTGVQQLGVAKEVWIAVGYFMALRDGLGLGAASITSLTDGQHMQGSLHYVGKAVDLETLDITPSSAVAIAEEMKRRLYPLGYDVVLEHDHLHVEFDPKPGRGLWHLGAENPHIPQTGSAAASQT